MEARPTVARAIIILLSGLGRSLARLCFTSRWRIVIFWNVLALVVFCALPQDWKMPGAVLVGFLLVLHLGVYGAKA